MDSNVRVMQGSCIDLVRLKLISLALSNVGTGACIALIPGV